MTDEELEHKAKVLSWKCQHGLCSVDEVLTKSWNKKWTDRLLCPLAKKTGDLVVPDTLPECKKVTAEKWLKVMYELL